MAACALEAESDLWNIAGVQDGRRVLDLGCGPGIFLPTLVERTGGAVDFIDWLGLADHWARSERDAPPVTLPR
jgi:cyclopropane fatty-acyl-phospholipid synthase-like methyltransferase